MTMKTVDSGTSNMSGAMTLSTEDTTNGDHGGLAMETKCPFYHFVVVEAIYDSPITSK